jgi:hypothetical protein
MPTSSARPRRIKLIGMGLLWKEAGETDDEAVDFAEGGEAKDFGGIVAAKQSVIMIMMECGVRGDLRDCSVV